MTTTGFKFAFQGNSQLPYDGCARKMALYILDKIITPEIKALGKQCSPEEKEEVLSDREKMIYHGVYPAMLTAVMKESSLSTRNAGNCDMLFSADRRCSNNGNFTVVDAKAKYSESTLKTVTVRNVKKDSLVEEAIKEKKTLFYQGQEVENDGKCTMNLLGRIAFMVTAATNVVVSGDSSRLTAVYNAPIKGLKVYDPSVLSKSLVAQFATVTDIKKKDDLYNRLYNTPAEDLYNLFHTITLVAPTAVRKGNVRAIGERLHLRSDVVTANHTARDQMAMLLVSRSLQYKGTAHPRVCGMFDSLPLTVLRKHMDILHDLPSVLDYEAVYLDTKDTTLARRVLKVIEGWKNVHKDTSKTLVYYNCVKFATVTARSDILDGMKVIKSGVVSYYDKVETEGKVLVYLTGKAKFSTAKIAFQTVANARVDAESYRSQFLYDRRLTEGERVHVVHRVHALSFHHKVLASNVQTKELYDLKSKDFLVSAKELDVKYALSASAYNGYALTYTGATYAHKGVANVMQCTSYTSYAVYQAYVLMWSRQHGGTRSTKSGTVMTFVRPTFNWYSVSDKEILSIMEEQEMAFAEYAIVDDLAPQKGEIALTVVSGESAVEDEGEGLQEL